MMRGVILAGGTGSRLYPLTKVYNKALLPIGKKPMIYHAIDKMKEIGIREIMVITGTEHLGDIVSCLGSGAEFGVAFTYRVQDKPEGIAQALGLAEQFCGNERICMILSDNIFEESLKKHAEAFAAQDVGARVLLREVPDPERFGVATLSEDEQSVVEIVEKPKEPKSKLAVVGIYFYDSEVFNIIKDLKPSARGEYEISDVHQEYIKRGKLKAAMLKGGWIDVGLYESWLKANILASFGENPYK